MKNRNRKASMQQKLVYKIKVWFTRPSTFRTLIYILNVVDSILQAFNDFK